MCQPRLSEKDIYKHTVVMKIACSGRFAFGITSEPKTTALAIEGDSSTNNAEGRGSEDSEGSKLVHGAQF